MRDRELPPPLVLGFSAEAQQMMRDAYPQRLARWQREVELAIEGMTAANAVEMLESVRSRTWGYVDREQAAADLVRALARYREVTGRRAPRRLRKLI